MIQVTSHMRIFAATEPMDFRKRLDGTVGVCRSRYEMDPYNGSVYLFRNRRKTMIRIYCFDGLVEWACDLRIAEGKFPYWPTSASPMSAIKAHELYLLIRGGDPDAVRVQEDWRKIS
jgi:transposase